MLFFAFSDNCNHRLNDAGGAVNNHEVADDAHLILCILGVLTAVPHLRGEGNALKAKSTPSIVYKIRNLLANVYYLTSFLVYGGIDLHGFEIKFHKLFNLNFKTNSNLFHQSRICLVRTY